MLDRFGLISRVYLNGTKKWSYLFTGFSNSHAIDINNDFIYIVTSDPYDYAYIIKLDLDGEIQDITSSEDSGLADYYEILVFGNMALSINDEEFFQIFDINDLNNIICSAYLPTLNPSETTSWSAEFID